MRVSKEVEAIEIRDRYRRAGMLPVVAVGTLVRLEWQGRQCDGVVCGRLPGRVYWVKFSRPVDGLKRVILSAANFIEVLS